MLGKSYSANRPLTKGAPTGLQGRVLADAIEAQVFAEDDDETISSDEGPGSHDSNDDAESLQDEPVDDRAVDYDPEDILTDQHQGHASSSGGS